jgi:enoyl-CoA hydratase
MSFENIIYEEDGNVAVIKFNRPKALNAINPDVLKEVGQVLDKIEAEGIIKVLVLTGEGNKAFIAGADIGHMASFSPLQGRQFSLQGQKLLFRWKHFPSRSLPA